MYNISACRYNQWRQFQPLWGKNILTPFCERGQQRPEKSWVAKTVPCFSSPSLKPGQNTFCPCLKINAIYKDAASHTTYWSSPTHDTKPSRGMKSPLWMHQSFILWLVKTGYYHRHLFSRQSKNPKVQLLHQNPVTLLPQRPWLQDAAASFTEGTRLKGAAFRGLSVFTICASKEGHKEGNHIFACKQWMPQGLASSWESV